MVMPTVSLPLPRYTVDDLDRFPTDGSRYELLEGWLIVSPSPGSVHQALVGRLFRRLDEYVGDWGRGHVYPGGDVRRGTSTLLIPDVLVASPQGRPGLEWSAMTDRWLAIEVHRTAGAEPVIVADVLRWAAPGTDVPLVLEVAALFTPVLGDDAP